ncbi:MAG: pilus assembly FimT family protein [Pirellulales bacterium]|jgi:prepilin-type N-terminal cleavage/methylation domain-containing protein
MMRRFRQSDGFSLLELLIVVAIMGIVAGLLLPSMSPSIHDQLEAAAQLVATDLAYGRSLAVANNSPYRFTFNLAQNRYILEHNEAAKPALDVLPITAFHPAQAPPKQYVVDLDELPRIGTPVLLAGVVAMKATPEAVTEVEFGPLGQTSRAEESVVWLSCGANTATRYLSVRVNPVTGMTWIEDFRATKPPLGTGSQFATP